jgi:hypothetical protein
VDLAAIVANLKNVGDYLTEKGRSEVQRQLNVTIAAVTQISIDYGKATIKIQELEKQLDRRKRFKPERGVYWVGSDRTQPYCPVCFAKNLDIMLQPIEGWSSSKNTEWQCRNCDKCFNPWDYHDNEQISTGNITSMWPNRY